ncbi:hypothetical protein JAAARDRAFT_37412 [Jaapia argillacea MUCL 33604]|uniref:Uncharacterized protein n=1 Tax=Jaapia argillacea MUCL 33604 TaxID=933084 RepID=A0A067PKF2_9AGAM|nr:hypothetical protein JAAARDRAFT_37412 [Jaapia argillacea MUCL 33604]
MLRQDRSGSFSTSTGGSPQQDHHDTAQPVDDTCHSVSLSVKNPKHSLSRPSPPTLLPKPLSSKQTIGNDHQYILFPGLASKSLRRLENCSRPAAIVTENLRGRQEEEWARLAMRVLEEAHI